MPAAKRAAAARGTRQPQRFTAIDFAGLPGLPEGKTCKVLFANRNEVESKDWWVAVLALSALALACSLAILYACCMCFWLWHF